MGENSRVGGPATTGSGTGEVAVLFSRTRTRLVLSGEIDAALAPELSEAISEVRGAGQPIDVDARTITFMDSSGAALIAGLARQGPEVRVIQPPDAVRFVLGVTAIDALVEILDDCPEFPEAAVDGSSS